MYNLINFLCGYSWLNYRMACIECFSCNPTRLAQLFEIFFIIDYWRIFVRNVLEVGIRLASLRIVWLWDRVGHRTFTLEAIREWSERAFIKPIILNLLFLLMS